MTFDIHALDEDDGSGDYEERFEAFQDGLLELFLQSPEGIAYNIDPAEDPENSGFWAAMFLYYGYMYVGTPLSEMDEDDADEVVYNLFPRKISLRSTEEAEGAIAELIAFWTFLKRAFALESADEVLGYLNDIPDEMFIEAMFDPARSGMGKSLVMAGTAAGYDMSNEVELNKFMLEYNARVLSEDPPEYDESPFDLLSSESLPPIRLYSADEAKKKKNKRKQTKASRKKNRKRKK